MNTGLVKDFPLGHVLSIITERLITRSQPPIDCVYEILNFMSGDSLYTHQLPRVSRQCKPWLLQQFPQLEAVAARANEITAETYLQLLGEWETEYGTTLLVESLPEDWHTRIDPVEEAKALFGDDKVICLSPGE